MLLVLGGNTQMLTLHGCHVPQPQKMSQHRHFLSLLAPYNLFIKIKQPLGSRPAAFSVVLAVSRSSDLDVKRVCLEQTANVSFFYACWIENLSHSQQ